MPEIANFRDLFYFNVRRTYDAEKRIAEALPAFAGQKVGVKHTDEHV